MKYRLCLNIWEEEEEDYDVEDTKEGSPPSLGDAARL